MPWKIEYLTTAVKAMRRLDPLTRRRIRDYLEDRIANLDDPRMSGDPLAGSLTGLRRYRVGDYRIICDIQDARLVVLVVRVGHRREVYRD